MDIDKIAKELADNIEKFNNKNKLTWKDVYEKELNSVKGINDKNKDLVLIRIVREISKRGYIIEDNPFKLIK